MITYKKRLQYKYNLREDCFYKTGVKVKKPGDHGYLTSNENGDMTMKKGVRLGGAKSTRPDILTAP